MDLPHIEDNTLKYDNLIMELKSRAMRLHSSCDRCSIRNSIIKCEKNREAIIANIDKVTDFLFNTRIPTSALVQLVNFYISEFPMKIPSRDESRDKTLFKMYLSLNYIEFKEMMETTVIYKKTSDSQKAELPGFDFERSCSEIITAYQQDKQSKSSNHSLLIGKVNILLQSLESKGFIVLFTAHNNSYLTLFQYNGPYAAPKLTNSCKQSNIHVDQSTQTQPVTIDGSPNRSDEYSEFFSSDNDIYYMTSCDEISFNF